MDDLGWVGWNGSSLLGVGLWLGPLEKLGLQLVRVPTSTTQLGNLTRLQCIGWGSYRLGLDRRLGGWGWMEGLGLGGVGRQSQPHLSRGGGQGRGA